MTEPLPPESTVAARPQDGPESGALSAVGLIELERRRRRMRALLALGFLVALGAAGYGVLAYNDARARQRADAAYGSLSRCLIGEPLAAGERPSGRFRATQLTAMAIPIALRSSAGELPWPQVCAPHAHRLNEALRDAGRAGKDEKGLAAASERLAKLLQEDKSTSGDLTEAIELVWADAQTEQVHARPATDVSLPPAAARPLDADSLKAVPALSPKSFALATVHEPPMRVGTTLRFLVDQKEIPNGPALCTSKRGAAEVRCAKLPPTIAALSPGLRLWGTADDDAPTFVFAGDRGSAGIFRADGGERVGGTMTYGAHARKDGSLATLSWDEKEKKVRLSQGRGASEHLWSTDDVGNPYYNVGLLWEHLVWKAVSKDGALQLYARPVGAGEAATVTVGELAEASRITPDDESPHIAGCRTSEATIARVRGSRNEQISVLAGGRWLAPVIASGLDGVLTCRGAEATITRIEYGDDGGRYSPSIEQNRCSAAGCRTAEVTMKQLTDGVREMTPQGPASVVAADVDGKLLVVWAPGGSGGVRMKMAPIEEIAKAPMVVLYDDFRQDGAVKPLTTLFEMRLFSRGDAAVLLLSTFSGVHALLVEPGAKIAPIPVVW